MFLTDHTHNTVHLSEGGKELICSITALFFDTGVIYHVAYDNGEVVVVDRTSVTGSYLGHEVFHLPEIRHTTTEIDFSNVELSSNRYSGTVNVDGQVIYLPQSPYAFANISGEPYMDPWAGVIEEPRPVTSGLVYDGLNRDTETLPYVAVHNQDGTVTLVREPLPEHQEQPEEYIDW